METTRKTINHFVLVHGICQGAWSWYKLIPLLKMGGNRVTAIDLGGCGINPNTIEDVSSFYDYCRPLMDFFNSQLEEENERVVLIGHSFSGLCISYAMQIFPQKISVAVFVSAYMPKSNFAPADLIFEVIRNLFISISLFFFFFNFDDSQLFPCFLIIFYVDLIFIFLPVLQEKFSRFIYGLQIYFQ